MGYFSKVQVIPRGEKNRQYYLICPAPLAQALQIEKLVPEDHEVRAIWELR